MTASAKDIKAQLAKVAAYLDQLGGMIEERDRLVTSLKLAPSLADNLDLINILAKIQSTLRYLLSDISAGFFDYAADFATAVDSYTALLAQLASDQYVDAHEYAFTEKVDVQDDVGPSKKSVRFKDYDFEEEDDDTTQMRNELMGTANNFKPYRDEPDRNSLLSVDTTNQEMFAQHQQQLMEQDLNLDTLHQSIRTQHNMGLTINDELDEHLIILSDLERGVDASGSLLRRATNGIHDFRRKVRENGSLVTIIVLTVILILLLVVLN